MKRRWLGLVGLGWVGWFFSGADQNKEDESCTRQAARQPLCDREVCGEPHLQLQLGEREDALVADQHGRRDVVQVQGLAGGDGGAQVGMEEGRWMGEEGEGSSNAENGSSRSYSSRPSPPTTRQHANPMTQYARTCIVPLHDSYVTGRVTSTGFRYVLTNLSSPMLWKTWTLLRLGFFRLSLKV